MEDRLMWIVGAVCAALIALLVWAAIVGAREWEAFKIAHGCRVVAQVAPSTAVGWDYSSKSGGAVVVTSPGKTGWLCDDAVTYYR